MRTTVYGTVLLASLVSSSGVYALDLDAGDYDYIPSGTNLAMLYYQHANRDQLYAGSEALSGNYRLNSDIAIARYVHYMDWAGVQIAPQILVPFGRLSAGKDNRDMGDSSGLGDIILANTFFVYHNPESKTNVGITPFLYLPTGKYERDEALNIGENRYKLTLQGAFTTQLTEQLYWDAAADVTFYGKNDKARGEGSLKQDPGLQVQTNMRYKLNSVADIRAGVSYSDFGDTKQNAVTHDANTQSKFWVGTAFSPSATTQLVLTYGRDFKVENGFKEDQRINLRLLKAF